MPSHHKIPVTKNIATTTVARFQRQELKFFMDNHVVDLLIPELENYLQRDRFSSAGPYEIYSLYFDTIDWQAFYSKLDGNRRRQKFRLRSYIAEPGQKDNIFAEVKEKNGSTVYKRRTPIALQSAQEIAKGRSIPKQSPVINEWRFSVIRNNLKPKLLNSYTRLAYHSTHFPGLRITIDQDLRYALTDTIAFNTPTKAAYWATSRSVIEIKFDRYVPQFVVDIIRSYNLTQTPVSKYCDSVISHFLLS